MAVAITKINFDSLSERRICVSSILNPRVFASKNILSMDHLNPPYENYFHSPIRRNKGPHLIIISGLTTGQILLKIKRRQNHAKMPLSYVPATRNEF